VSRKQQTDPETFEVTTEQLAALGVSLASVTEVASTVAHKARAFRDELEAAGWSPSIAEQMAATTFLQVMQQMFTQAGGDQ
jgi:hypothetical protein